jgi:TRAP-type C4-dicarboxylate transport system substrate-binding protein
MNVLELKGSLFEAVSHIQDETALYRILNFVQKTAKEESQDWWHSLPSSVQTEIEAAYEESEDESLLLSHEEVSKKYEKWL